MSMRHNNHNYSSSPREPMGVHETQVHRQKHMRRGHQQQQQQQPSSSLPFDKNGYCFIHPDICMAKRKSRGGWNVRLEQCPKCCQLRSRRDGSKRQLSGDTESLTSEDSREQRHKQQQSQDCRRRNRSCGPTTRRDNPSRQSSFRSPTNSNHSQYGQQQHGHRSRSRGRKNGQQTSSKLQYQPPQSPGGSHLDYHCIDFDPNLRPPCRGGSRCSSRRDGHATSRSPIRSRMRPARSLSRSSHRSRGDCSRGEQRSMGSRRRSRRPSFSNNRRNSFKLKRTVCVDGRPFDKNGRCFIHSHVKLASKKILGGWKIHMEYCPLCMMNNEDDNDNGVEEEGDGRSVISGISHLTDDTGYTNSSSYRSLSRRSMRSSSFVGGHGNSNASICSRKSMRSTTGSMKSETGSWSSGHSSKKRVKGIKDDSFLPLDEDGYCLQHPGVQLAKISKKGGWRVLMDFCPECAGDSLISGNNLISRKISMTSVGNSSCKSSRSGRSASSHSTFIESMPYIDGDGKPGHYTGHVDMEGQPNGRGLMKYINGAKFDGIWHEGIKLNGKTTTATNKKKDKKQTTLMRKNTPPTPPPAPAPPPTYPPLHVGAVATQENVSTGGKLKKKVSKHADEKLDDHHRISRRDLPPRGRSSTGNDDYEQECSKNNGRRPRRSLSRLRKKCDEIESLLRGYPTSTKDVK